MVEQFEKEKEEHHLLNPVPLRVWPLRIGLRLEQMGSTYQGPDKECANPQHHYSPRWAYVHGLMCHCKLYVYPTYIIAKDRYAQYASTRERPISQQAQPRNFNCFWGIAYCAHTHRQQRLILRCIPCSAAVCNRIATFLRDQ